jgi:hypothetical protein
MAMNDASTPGRIPAGRTPLRRAVHVLFPEARQLERRRRLRYLALLLLVAAIVVGAVRSTGPGRTRPGTVHGTSATVTSVALPRADRFSSLAAVGGRLLLLGGSPPASGYPTSLIHGRAAGTCDAATVDPQTLAVGAVRRANCGDPALYGQPVLPVAYYVRGDAPNNTAIRIAHANPAARDGYTLGPVVTTYQQCSDCQAAWIYGDGSLWIYNADAHPRGGSGVLLRISRRTGAVVERWVLPVFLRPLLAVDSDGLWLSPSVETGAAGPRASAAQRAAENSLYRISPGVRAPQPMLEGHDGDARWLVAAGNTASAAVDTGRGYSRVWKFAGNGRPVHGPALGDSPMGTEYGVGVPVVAGNAKIGYFNVVFNQGSESVIQVAPNGAHERSIAKIRSAGSSDNYLGAATATVDGSLFYVDPTTKRGQHGSELRRVTPR